MFSYFPERYLWNLAVVATLNNGGAIDEVDRACMPLREMMEQGHKPGAAEFYESWKAVADRLTAGADADLAHGFEISAAAKLYRASLYLSQAGRMNPPSWFSTNSGYQDSIDLLARHLELAGPNVRRVEIPVEGGPMPTYLHLASPPDGTPTPTIIQWNGVDSTKEMMYFSGLSHQLAARGISTLMVDMPGTGEALRMRGMTAHYDTEKWATACVDSLETVNEVASDRIGIVGWSLGGYFAPRAAAFEKRLKLVVAWDANHDWGTVQRERWAADGNQNLAPHYWEMVCWVWGVDTVEQLIEVGVQVRLDGVAELVTVPFLITHGLRNRQISVDYARRTFEQATASPKRELRIFDDSEGGVETIGLDNMPEVAGFIADWISQTFAELDHTSAAGNK